jgi:hypothetical protein
MKYNNPSDYIVALERELERVSHSNELFLAELRKDMALERLIARFDPDKSAVKGGFGVRTLVAGSPLTQDIDLLIENKDWQALNKDQLFKFVAEYVVDHITTEGPDQFKFTPTSSARFADLDSDQAAARIWAQVSVAGRSFGAVVIDAGVKQANLPTERASGRDVLAFAEVENPVITTLSREYLIADKVTLFLQKGVEGDRPRDVVHAALLLENGKYNEDKLAEWLDRLGEQRGVAGYLGETLEPAPKSWAMKVNSICDRYGLQLTADLCYDRIGGLLERLRGRER